MARRMTILLLLGLPLVVAVNDPTPPAEGLESAFQPQDDDPPYASRTFPDNVHRGDTHLHTGMSMDAGAFGARLLPNDACEFARAGGRLLDGLKVRLSRPLDFLAVADHSDNMASFQGCSAPTSAGPPYPWWAAAMTPTRSSSSA